MKNLSKEHKAAAKSIISAGLVKAAESLSFFMNETITLQEFDQEKHLSTPPPEINKKDQTIQDSFIEIGKLYKLRLAKAIIFVKFD